MPWLVCWVVSGFLRLNDLKDEKGNIQKWKEKAKWSFKKTGIHAIAWTTQSRARSEEAAMRPHDWRGCAPQVEHPRRGRVTDATAWQRKAPNDVTAWPTRTRDRGYAPEIAENAHSEFWSPFWPKSKSRRHRPEVMKWGNASIQRESPLLVSFHDLDLV